MGRRRDRRRRRRPLPGEGSDRLGSNFDQGLPAGDPEEVVNLSVNTGILGDFVTELTALAVMYRQDLENGYWGLQRLVSTFLALPHLRALWPMSSMALGDAYDVSGQGRTLDGNGALQFGVDALGGRLLPLVSFGAANPNRHLSRSDEQGLNWSGLNSYMMVGWVKPRWTATTAGIEPIMSKGDEDTGSEYLVAVDRPSLRLKVTAGDEDYTAPESRALVRDEWNFVAAGYDGTADEFVVAVNGWRNRVSGGSPTLSATTDDFYLGRHKNGASNDYFQGEMSMVAFLGRALSEEHLGWLYEWSRLVYG